MFGPSGRYPGSQRYSSTVPTGNELLLVSVRLVEPCCTVEGLTQPERKEEKQPVLYRGKA